MLGRHIGRVAGIGWKGVLRAHLGCYSANEVGKVWRKEALGTVVARTNGLDRLGCSTASYPWRSFSSDLKDAPQDIKKSEDHAGNEKAVNTAKGERKRKSGRMRREAERETELEAQEEEGKKDRSVWEYDEPSEYAFTGDEERAPSPILDAYERSKDPEMLERLIQEAYDSLPPRAGPRRNNEKRRQHQRFRAIRNIRYRAKEQRIAAYERKLQKRRERKERDFALFATWRQGPSEKTAT